MSSDDRGAHPVERKRSRLVLRIAGAAIAVSLVLGVIVPLAATADPSFLSRFGNLAPRYKTWHSSKHRDVSCFECHYGNQTDAAYRLSLIAEFYKGLMSPGGSKPAILKLERPTSQSCLKCHSEEWNIDSSRLVRIPHPAHIRVVDEKRDCVKCHKWVAHAEKYTEKHKKITFTGICTSYGCHSGTKSPQECRFCHHTQSFPAPEWRRKHPGVALVRGTNSCLDYCHQAKQCRTCHTTGKNPFVGAAKTSRGPRALIAKHSNPRWIVFHGAEARVDRNRCFYCHGAASVCTECHSRRPAFHGPKATWLQAHQKQGKANKTRCLACHSQKDCDSCHTLFKEGR